jgi:hypothetical protein
MSSYTTIAEALSFAPIPDGITPYQVQPKSWLGEAGMTHARYAEEMDIVLDCFFGHLHPALDMMNELPDTPELTGPKSEINAIIRAPFTRPQNPMTVMLDASRVLVDVIEYYHNSRSKKQICVKASDIPQDIIALKEIAPQNVNQRRAMVLLKILKAKPKEALHTEDCKRILEGAEGTALDSKVVRRAMCVLAEIYNPGMVYENVAGSYRVRVNF